MAQACVMVQRNIEGATQQQCMLTPVPPSSPDASFITSSVRKRKDVREGEAPEEKRVRVIAGTHASLCSPEGAHNGTQHAAAEPIANGHGACYEGGEPSQREGILFSPAFHLLEKDGTEPPPPSRPCTPLGENNSTDASTGTSASLDQDESAGEGSGAVCPPPGVLVPTSPAPCPPPPSAPAQPADEEDEEWEFDPFLFIKRLPALHECIPPRTSFLLPRQTRHSKRKTLVLDLDETLVHSTLDGDCIPDFTFAVQMGTVRHMVAVRMRPHLHFFLNQVAELFEVVVFTASQQIYAEQLLDIIDPGQKYIKHRVYRDSCVLWEGNYLKDLTVLGRDLAHTLIIDNSPQAFGFQLENGVPIESWYDDNQDTELLKMLPFLQAAATSEDVRPLILEQFRLKELVDNASVPISQQIFNRLA